MKKPLNLRRFVLAAAFVMAFAPMFVRAQAPQAGPAVSSAGNPTSKAITLDDYPRFKRIGGASISGDGKWMYYTVTPNEGDATLFIKAFDTPTSYEIPRGSNASFSDNSRWVAYFVTPPSGRGGRGAAGAGAGGGGRGGATQGGEGGQAPARTFEVLDLTNGSKTTFPAVDSFSFSPDGEWLLMRPQAAAAAPAAAAPAAGGRGGGARGGGAGASSESADTPGTDLLMRNLASGAQRYIGNVGSYVFDDSGKTLAYTVRGQSKLGNGVYLMNISSGDARMLDAKAADYDQLTWSSEGINLAVLRGEKARGNMLRDNVLIAWNNAGAGNMRMTVIDPAKAAGMPAKMVISEFTGLRWSGDGSRILLGLKAQDAERPASNEPQANVDVWHFNDDQPQSVQIVQVNQARRATQAAVVDLAAGSIRKIADEDMTAITPTDDLMWAVGRIDKPYRGQVSWGGSKADIYRVNLSTGDRALIEPGLFRSMGFSPDGKWFLYLKGGRVHSYETATGKKTQIDGTKSFVNAEDDHDYEKPVYGVAGFTADGKSVLLYDRYDLWSLPLAGGSAPMNLTKGEGAKQQVRFRVSQYAAARGGGGGGRGGGRGGGGAVEPIDLAKPLTFQATGEWTKKSGYFEMAPGGSPAPLIWLDKNVGAPTVAKYADRMIFTEQTFTEFPNYWLSDKRFTAPKQVTDADPTLMKEFAWGSKVLIDYQNRFKQKLQATLTLPANYVPGRKYPMLVYFYELMSDTHHNFQVPPYDDRPHISTYASNGYMVLQPDVVYEIGKPGTSALDCVTSAVKKAIELGYADPARIGLQGHSWGGYQSSFILTQTDIFAAIVTGAPPTNLTSFVGTLYPSTGTLQQGITEVGQVRMGRDVTPWSAHALYESQSPIHNAPNIKTPFLILHGTADGAVDWSQGLELYAAARRLGKKGILLSYPDEPHHLANRANQKDFQLRMKQFFDHYLKGTPAPLWMTEGVPQIKKGSDPTIIK